jgi:single-strand DNA-binding protein
MSDVHVTLSGYVASEVEFKEGFNRAGERMAHNDRAFFRLGATPRYFDRSAGRWRDGETVWLTVKAWRALAHNVASSLSLGQPVVVVGKLKTSVWKGEDGQVHSREVLEATVVGHDLNRGTSAFSRTSGRPSSTTRPRRRTTSPPWRVWRCHRGPPWTRRRASWSSRRRLSSPTRVSRSPRSEPGAASPVVCG